MVDRAEVRKLRDKMREEWEALGAAIAGLDALLGADQEAAQPVQRKVRMSTYSDSPKGVEAIRRVLADADGAEMTVKEITEALAERGWSPESTDPVNATSSTAGRAVEVFPEIVRRRAPGSAAYLYRHTTDQASVVRGVDLLREVSTNGHHAPEVMT